MRAACVLALAGLLLAGAGCEEDRRTPADGGPLSFRVDLLDAPGVPRPFSIEATGIQMQVTALGPGGAVAPWDGHVEVRIEPGRVTRIDGGGASGAQAAVVAGRSEVLTTMVSAASGDARIWVEDVGFKPPAAGSTPQCSNGVDDDGDGLADDAQDAGCFGGFDDDERGGSHVLGVSDPLTFSNPRLKDVQGTTGASPLDGGRAVIDPGHMIVTAIRVNGFYVTDIAPDGDLASMFVFTFQTPFGTRPCDRVTALDGVVSEFFGLTELSFPSWQLEHPPSGAPCAIPEPTVVDEALLGSRADMEPLESGLVRLENVLVGGEFIDCDHNGDGSVDLRNRDSNECNAECSCLEQCQSREVCTERTSFRQFGQYAAALEGGAGPKVYVVSRSSIPEFRPERVADSGGVVVRSVVGTLRELSFLRPTPWIVEPRCPDDLTLDGEPVPIHQACVAVPDLRGPDDPEQ